MKKISEFLTGRPSHDAFAQKGALGGGLPDIDTTPEYPLGTVLAMPCEDGKYSLFEKQRRNDGTAILQSLSFDSFATVEEARERYEFMQRKPTIIKHAEGETK